MKYDKVKLKTAVLTVCSTALVVSVSAFIVSFIETGYIRFSQRMFVSLCVFATALILAIFVSKFSVSDKIYGFLFKKTDSISDKKQHIAKAVVSDLCIVPVSFLVMAVILSFMGNSYATSEISRFQTEIQKLTVQCDAKQAEFESLSAEYDTIQSEYDAILKKYDDKKAEIENIEAETNVDVILSEEITEDNRLVIMQTELADIEFQMSAQKTVLDKSKSGVKALDSAVAGLRTGIDEKTASMNAVIKPDILFNIFIAEIAGNIVMIVFNLFVQSHLLKLIDKIAKYKKKIV